MELTELSEICLRKLFELGPDYTSGNALPKIYAGPTDEKSILEFLKQGEEKTSRLLSLKIKRKLVLNEDITFNASEKFYVSLRLLCAQSSLGRLCQRSFLESHLVPRLPTDQTNEALLWATTNFWNFQKHEFLQKFSKMQTIKLSGQKNQD